MGKVSEREADCPEQGRALLRCSGCKFAHFCDAACQKGGWEAAGGHKAECARLKAAFPNAPSPSALFYARLIDALLAGGVP